MERFADLSKGKILKVVQRSAQKVFSTAQTDRGNGGRMPVDTGFLRNSFQAGLNGAENLTGADAYTLAIAGMELGDVMRGGWTAKYAMRMEYGFVGTDAAGRTYNQMGYHFAGTAAAQWPAIVAAEASKIRNE